MKTIGLALPCGEEGRAQSRGKLLLQGHRLKPGGKGYIMEWAMKFDPCLEVEPGKLY